MQDTFSDPMCFTLLVLCLVKPLSPNSDLNQISYCNIRALPAREVMRIETMATQVQLSLYFNSFSPLLLKEMHGDKKVYFDTKA